mgnify:CR=1 FL=1
MEWESGAVLCARTGEDRVHCGGWDGCAGGGAGDGGPPRKGRGRTGAAAWVNGRIGELNRGDIASLLEAIRQAALSAERPDPVIETEMEYFRKNEKRMR